ncbi:MAG TPA: flagellar hook-associated protein FlgK [Deltaproteobacteria bacterium]|nr:flagellar hook-associated protein FlgK [Deltaproteobacteria bacterium]
MPTINSVLNIAKTAIQTSQQGLNVTAQNLANVNTPGYTRQQAVQTNAAAVPSGGLYFGTGVTVEAIQRVYDSFVEKQLRDSMSSMEYYGSKGQVVSNLEGVLNDLDGTGLSAVMDDFFNALNDLANDPAAYPERVAVISTGTVLADQFVSIDSRARALIDAGNEKLDNLAVKLNSLASDVADLNDKIAAIEVLGTSANDLRDKRTVLLQEMAQIIDIQTVETEQGIVDVSVGRGFSLVAGRTTQEISTQSDTDNGGIRKILIGGTDISGFISGGSMSGVLEGVNYVKDTLEKVDLLAATVIKEVNTVHRGGYGLDSSTGSDFFKVMSVTSASRSQNTGGASVTSASITSLGSLTLQDYEIRFSSATAYTVVNTSTNSVVTSGTYSSGSAITFDGLSVTITDQSGTPLAGDVFSVSTTSGAARSMAVEISDPNKVAAASSSATLPGDNTNALALAALRDTAASSLSDSTLADYYQGIISEIGIVVNSADTNYSAQKTIRDQLQLTRDNISGVSVEEESINIIRLQTAYQAAARLVSTADELFRTLINIR